VRRPNRRAAHAEGEHADRSLTGLGVNAVPLPRSAEGLAPLRS